MDTSHRPLSLATSRGITRVSIAIGVVAILVVAWTVYAAHVAGVKLKEQTEAQAVVTVLTVKAQPMTDAAVLTLPGSVQAKIDAPIYARTNGYLKRWMVDIGAQVKAGQVLAEIDAPELDQQLRQAEADVASAEARLNIASITADRWQGLRETDSVSKQDADERVNLEETTAAQLQAAQANRQRLRELASFKKIVAPFEGVVTARNTDVGQLITAGTGAGLELFRIADTRQLRLYVRVPQSYAAQITPNLTAQVKFPDRPGRVYAATLEGTSSAIDATSRTLLAQLIVDNSKNELLPGAYAEVHFQLPAAAGGSSLKVPANTLLTRGDGLSVATVDAQGHVVLKPVTLGRDFGSDLEILSGITANDAVILNPPDSLTESTLVRVAEPETKAEAKL
ncbi:MAG TPA: efflux RND transporter periplasmic adaptor subunit [Steroidobacteraceae bacterium]|nr:efflux RND transporter periplasmic adaptor subunit [Steroidobacteraceae bacterium]